jgi:hypothetical protein
VRQPLPVGGRNEVEPGDGPDAGVFLFAELSRFQLLFPHSRLG